MNPFHWRYHCAAAEGRPLRPSYQAIDAGEEEQNEATAVDRLVFTRIRVGATDPVFIVSEIVPGRETEVRRAAPRRFSERVFRLPLFHTPPGGDEQPRPPNGWDPIFAGYRSAEQRALRETFAEQKATSAHHQPTLEPSDGQPQQGADQASRSPSPSIAKLLAPAQEYLQALREEVLPPLDLCEAWEAFYEACDPLVRRTVAACSMDRADVDDSIQEAWTEIAAKLTRFEYDENRGSFEAWLRIVVHRTACRHARRDHRQTAGRIDQDLSALTCPRILGPATTSQREELRASVRQTLDAFRSSVSSTAFRILVMTTVQGQTSIEIGKLLGLTPGHVRVSRHRTAQKFRQFVAARPGLAETFGVSPPPKKAAEIGDNPPPGEQFAELSRNCRDSL